MRVGLLADTHDHLPAVRALVGQLVDRGAEMLLHAGDFCSPFILETLHEAGLPIVGVFGRNDGDRDGLVAAARRALLPVLAAEDDDVLRLERARRRRPARPRLAQRRVHHPRPRGAACAMSCVYCEP